MRRNRGYVETSSLFGWIIFIAIVGAGIYFGRMIYDSYQAGYDRGHQLGKQYEDSEMGHYHGLRFEHALSDYIKAHRSEKDRNLKDKAYNYGWDSGLHDVVDKIPR